MAHVGEKFALGAAGGFGRVFCFAEPLGGVVPLGNVLHDAYVPTGAVAGGRNGARDHIDANDFSGVCDIAIAAIEKLSGLRCREPFLKHAVPIIRVGNS